MAAGTSPQQFEADIDAAQASSDQPNYSGDDDGGDWLISLFKPAATTLQGVPPPEASLDSSRMAPPSLAVQCDLSPDYDFAKTALQQLSSSTQIADFSLDDSSQTITLTAPRDFVIGCG